MEKRKRKKIVTTASIINIMQRWLLTAIEFILSFQALGTVFVPSRPHRLLYSMQRYENLKYVPATFRVFFSASHPFVLFIHGHPSVEGQYY